MLRDSYSGIYIIALLILVISHSLDRRFLRVRLAITTLLLLALPVWLFLDSLSGNGLNYATIYHLRTGLAGAGIADFKAQIWRFVGHIALALVLASAVTWIARRLARRSQIALFAYVSAVTTAMICNPLTQDVLRLSRLQNGDGSDVREEYARPSASSTLRNKNIVIVYAESLERTYFDESAFPGLVPNLQRLSTQGLDFTDVRGLRGTGWTIAGLVSSMCGVPLTVWRPEDGNSMGQLNRFLPGASCLTDWLADYGYSLEFMGGADSEFAGKAKFLSAHGFGTIRDSSYFQQMDLPPEAFSSWGLHDDILLKQAASRFDELSAQDSPFLLSVLTLDTHHPSGHVPAACGDMKYTGLDRSYPILDAVACSDQLIAGFVDHIRASPRAADTTILVVSDHLGMPNDAREIISSMHDKRRNMLLLLDQDIPPARIDQPATTVDTGAILMASLGGHGRVGFGRVPGDNANDGLTRTVVSGQDASPYHAFSQSLWKLGESSSVRLLTNGRIQIGEQQVAPPLSLIIDESGTASQLAFGPDFQDFTASAPNWIHINRCAAFKADAPSNWCAMESREDGQRYLFNQADLATGIKLGTTPSKSKRTYVDVASDYIIRTSFEDRFPHVAEATISSGSIFSNLTGGVLFNGPFLPMPAGRYHVRIKGQARGATTAWADVIAEGGKVRLAGGGLVNADEEAYDVFNADLTLDNDTSAIEVRVYAGAGEAVRIDGYELIPAP